MRKWLELALGPALAACVAGCGSGGRLPGTLPVLMTPSSTGAATGVYVTQIPTGVGYGSVLEFSATAQAATQPLSTLMPPPVAVEAVAVDAQGQIYVGARPPTASSAVYVFAAGASGSDAPIRTLSIASGMNPEAIAFDSAGNVYVGADSEIDVFAPGSTTPARVIAGGLTGLVEVDGIAVDAQGEIFVTNAIVGLGSVLVFSSKANGNVAPARSITGVNGNAPFYDPSGIALDAAGNLFVASYLSPATVIAAPSSIFEFAPGALGYPVPVKTISGANTGLNGVGCLRIDGAGNLYALIISPLAGGNGMSFQPSICVFSPNTSGNAAPIGNFTSASWTSPGSGQFGIY